jgi:hypothetical protein
VLVILVLDLSVQCLVEQTRQLLWINHPPQRDDLMSLAWVKAILGPTARIRHVLLPQLPAKVMAYRFLRQRRSLVLGGPYLEVNQQHIALALWEPIGDYLHLLRQAGALISIPEIQVHSTLWVSTAT